MHLKIDITKFVEELKQEDKNKILTFLLESQLLEYGIRKLLTELPLKNPIENNDISDKPLGVLISQMEKSQDQYILELVQPVRDFNKLRKEIVHSLIYIETPEEAIIKIREKIELAHRIRWTIDRIFNFFYEDVLKLNNGYGSIFNPK